MEQNEKPVLNVEFLRESLTKKFKVVYFPEVETLNGVKVDEFVFSSMRLLESEEKDCIAFMHLRHDDPHYLKIAEVLRQRHATLPDGDPNKLSQTQINMEVHKYRINELAEKAFKKGAALLISTTKIKDYPCLIVPDVKQAFLCLYESYVEKFGTKIIQVTGSYGKTSACQVVYDMFVANGKNTHRNKLNGNDYPGVFSAINRLNYSHEFYVQETQEAPISWVPSGMSEVLHPKVAIITNAFASHMTVMKTKANVAHACLGIADGVPKDGIVVINIDDPGLRKKVRTIKAPVVTYAINNKTADFYGENIKSTHSGITFDLVHKKESVQVKIAGLGEHNVYNALIGYITGKHLGLTQDEILMGIASFKTQGVRQNLIDVNGRAVCFDCYNASPKTMSDAISIISRTTLKSPEGRRVAVLGNMNGLIEAYEGHAKVGQAIAESDIDILITYGFNAAAIADTAKNKPGIKIIKTTEREKLAEAIQKETKPGDLILVKASLEIYLAIPVDMGIGTYVSLEAEENNEGILANAGKYKVRIKSTFTTVTGYFGDSSKLSPPRVITWKDSAAGASKTSKLYGIGSRAFAENQTAESVTIPNTVKVICEQAFFNCSNLKRAYIPSSVVNIEQGAFEGTPVTICGNLGSFAESYAKENNIPFEMYTFTDMKLTFRPERVNAIMDTGFLSVANSENLAVSLPNNESLALAEMLVSVKEEKTVYASVIALSEAKKFFKAAKDDSVGKLLAVKGFSETAPYNTDYHTGHALDILVEGLNKDEMQESRESGWLKNNAHRFGFIPRNPNEPWHYRYVGREHAYYMYENGLSLEEYIALIKEKGEITITVYDDKFRVFYRQPEDGCILMPKEAQSTVSRDNFGGYIVTADLNMPKTGLSSSSQGSHSSPQQKISKEQFFANSVSPQVSSDLEIINVGVWSPHKQYQYFPYNAVTGVCENAKKYGINLFYFSTQDINTETKTINGAFFDDAFRKYYIEEVAYPHVVDNLGYAIFDSPEGMHLNDYSTFTRNINLYPFWGKNNLNHLSNAMPEYEKFGSFILPSVEIKTFSDIETALEKCGDALVLKPVGGIGGGRGILKITKEGDSVYVDDSKEVLKGDMYSLKTLYSTYLIATPHVAQEYIKSVTTKNEPFAVRIFCKRGVGGIFHSIIAQATIGSGNVVANVNQSGSRLEKNVNDFIVREFPQDHDFVMKELNRIADEFPEWYQSSIPHEIFVMGLDIGIARGKDGLRFVLFENNLGPVAVGTYIKDVHAEISCGYYRYLYNKRC